MKKNDTNWQLTIVFNVLLVIGIASRNMYFSVGTHDSVSLAYLDPGTGTMIISAIIGILATIALGIKTFWYKIRAIFKLKTKK